MYIQLLPSACHVLGWPSLFLWQQLAITVPLTAAGHHCSFDSSWPSLFLWQQLAITVPLTTAGHHFLWQQLAITVPLTAAGHHCSFDSSWPSLFLWQQLAITVPLTTSGHAWPFNNNVDTMDNLHWLTIVFWWSAAFHELGLRTATWREIKTKQLRD